MKVDRRRRSKANSACEPRHRGDRDGRRAGAAGNLLPGVEDSKAHSPQQRATVSRGARSAPPRRAGAARQYTLDRKQFGRSLAANQLIQKKLADMEPRSRWASRVPAARTDEGRGQGAPEITSIMKRNSCGKVSRSRGWRDMHGGNGIVDEFHVIRHLLNLETVNTYEGTRRARADPRARKRASRLFLSRRAR